MLMFAFFAASFAYFNQFFIFPPLAHELGMTKFWGAMLVSVSNVTELISRLVVGILVDKDKVTKACLIQVSFMLSAVLAMAVSFSTIHTILFVYSALFGLLGGVFLPLAILILVELVPETHISSASGLFALVTGTGISLGPSVLGAIKALTGSFTDSLRVCSGFYLMAFVVFVLHEHDTMNCIRHEKRRKEHQEERTNLERTFVNQMSLSG
ncbi:hypothetical protein LSH36_1157g00063 [Paralvinella palmiformis]|uniref:Major facilitator superfamily (MFS) profile domain-containing protein n=1 Tax=Paralvinella palmiformis TaxID=53620 RepID=A0AAD9IUC3_9ANNE|nr:hypothetical protein LSH36_1157g00063 [Paralvinella palmiformis]